MDARRLSNDREPLKRAEATEPMCGRDTVLLAADR